jgi:nickel/cobalt exporter
MTRQPITLLVLVFAAAALMPLSELRTAHASRNPFIASKKPKESQFKSPAAGYPSFLQPIMQKIAATQQLVRQQMVRVAADIHQHPFGRSFWVFMLLSFLYGVIHALGPGHGKIYTSSYFLSHPGTFKKGLLFGNLTMLFHVLSGSILILGGSLVLKTSGAMTLENYGLVLERISYALLIGLGLWFAGRAVRQLQSARAHTFSSCPDTTGIQGLMFTALAVGIVPCPGAALILLFSLTVGILTAGIFAMICIAAGMAITVSLFAFLTISFQKSLFALVKANRRLFNAVYALLMLGGAACISALGCIMLLGSF